MQASRAKHPHTGTLRGRRSAAAVAVVLTMLALAVATALPSSAPAATRLPAWSDVYGPTTLSDEWRDIARGPGHTVFVTGTQAYGQVAGSLMTLAKYDAAGNRVWKTPTLPGVVSWLGFGGSAAGNAVAVDRHGNAIVAGESSWSGGNFCVVKFSGADGHVIWEQYLGGAGYAAARHVVLDGAGNAYVTGTVARDGAVGASAVYTVKLAAADGHLRWENWYEGPVGGKWTTGLAIDSLRNVYLTGGVIGGPAATNDWLTRKMSPSGKTLWTRRWDGGTKNSDLATGITTTPNGSAVYVCGYSENGTGTARAAVLMRLSPKGRRLWLRRYNEFETESAANGVCFDSTGALLLWGTRTPLDMTKPARTLLVKISPSGKTAWMRSSASRYNADGDARYYSLVPGPSGSMYLCGSEQISTDNDVMVEKRKSNGSLAWYSCYSWPDPSFSKAGQLVLDGTKRLFVTAWIERPQADGYVDAGLLGYRP